jgi:hypothetical protein
MGWHGKKLLGVACRLQTLLIGTRLHCSPPHTLCHIMPGCLSLISDMPTTHAKHPEHSRTHLEDVCKALALLSQHSGGTACMLVSLPHADLMLLDCFDSSVVLLLSSPCLMWEGNVGAGRGSDQLMRIARC